MKYIAKALLFLAVVVVAVNASCGNNCSAHGTCSNDVCVCTTGWGGDDCSIWDHEIQSGGTDSGHLATFEWRYYHVSLPNGANGITVSVTQTSNFGDIDLFVARDYYPNIQQFSFEDTSTGTQLEVNINPVAAGTWYIGIYGYWSADYEITIDVQFACTVDCGPHGFCDGSVCACYDPYTSEDCSIYDESIESGQSISNTVASGEWKYFNIDVQSGDSMTLTLTQETTRYDLDVYIAANRYPTARNFDYLNATTMQTTEMHLTNLASGHYEIGIFGYHGGNFNLVVTVSHVVAENCENSCSTHGSCAGDVCSCYNGYSGNYCETYGPNIALGEDYSGYVESGKWNYWHLHYFTQSSMRINVAQTTPGDCDLYVRQNIDPSRINYQYTDLTLNMDFSITIQHPGDETWHIGVYGWTGCSYTLSAEILDDCQCTQESNGSCQEGSTQCVCQLGYAGPLCTIPAPSIANGQVLSEQSVAPHSWKYYHFTSDSSAVFITMVETSTSGELFLTASLSGYPSGENFEYYDIAESDFHEIQIVWTSQRTPRTYFIGVLTSSTTVATEPVEFSITAFGTPF